MEIEKTKENITHLYQKLSKIRSSSDDSVDFKITELDEIGEKILEAKAALEAYALKTDTSIRSKLSTVPLLNKFIKSAQTVIDKNKNIGTILNEMLNYFDAKYDVIVLKVEDFENLRNKLVKDVLDLKEWIQEAEALRGTVQESKAQVLAIDKQITIAKMDILTKEDTVEKKIIPSITTASYLAENINALSPILKGALQDELRITSGLNTFKDASSMLVELKTLVVDLKKINNTKTEEMLIDTLTNANTALFSAEELDELLEMSEKSSKNVIAHAKKVHELSIKNISDVAKVENKFKANKEKALENK